MALPQEKKDFFVDLMLKYLTIDGNQTKAKMGDIKAELTEDIEEAIYNMMKASLTTFYTNVKTNADTNINVIP